MALPARFVFGPDDAVKADAIKKIEEEKKQKLILKGKENVTKADAKWTFWCQHRKCK